MGGIPEALELERAKFELGCDGQGGPRRTMHGSGAVRSILAGGTNARRVSGRPTVRVTGYQEGSPGHGHVI